MALKAAHECEAGFEVFGGQGLGFVKDDDGVGNIVQLAAAFVFGGEEGFKELYVGGDDQGGIPVFGQKSVGFAVVFLREVAVVLEHAIFSQNLAEDACGLVDDAGVGDDVDDALFAVETGVFQSETEG